MLRTFLVLFALAGVAVAAPIQLSSSELFVHDGSGLIGQLNGSSATYFSTLDAQNHGQYGWTFTNAGSVTLTDLRFIAFLDADLDRDDNTFFNEYGEFVGMALPPAAVLGIAASRWEIDEPGFLYGNIYSNALAGVLDNDNGVTSAFPDDVSMALLFNIGALDPGRTATITLILSSTSINGLRQLDSDSGTSFYWNGYATFELTQPPPTDEVPEPRTLLLFTFLIPVAFAARRRRV